MAASIYAAPFPQPDKSFLNPDGTISRVWIYFLMGIFARSGGNQPIPVAMLQQEFVNLSVEEAMSGEMAAIPNPLLPLAAVMTNEDAPANLSAVTLIGAFADDMVRPPLDPVLASLLIADAT